MTQGFLSFLVFGATLLTVVSVGMVLVSLGVVATGEPENGRHDD